MRLVYWLAGTFVALGLLVGCEVGGGGGGSGGSLNIVGDWKLTVRSEDGAVSFRDTAMTISLPSNSTTYAVTWLGEDGNGSATVDTNTDTILIDIHSPSADLDLEGIVHDNDAMDGGGTVDGFGGIRSATWNAKR